MKQNKAVLTLFSLLLTICLISCAVMPDSTKDDDTASLVWVREESRYISHTVQDDFVWVEYELCYENESDFDMHVSTNGLASLGIILSEKQTAGWIEHQEVFFCEEINGQKGLEIKAGQKIQFRARFCGKHLGGEPDEDNMFPMEVGFFSNCIVYESTPTTETVVESETTSPTNSTQAHPHFDLNYSNQMYSYAIYDTDRNIVLSGELKREPRITDLYGSMVKFTYQAGTGLSTQYGYYYNYVENILSQKFDCIYDETDTLVATGGVKKVIVRSIFDDTYYTEITEFEMPLSPIVEPIVNAEFSNDHTSITVTYLSGENHTTCTEQFLLPPESN